VLDSHAQDYARGARRGVERHGFEADRHGRSSGEGALCAVGRGLP
jgi:hypothetical protein